MFVGRERELDLLQSLYESGQFEFVGIYGRRRVGKTALISQFTRKLPCGWCAAVEDDASLNLQLLSQAVYSMSNPETDASFAPVYPDFKTAIEAAFIAAQSRRIVLVIDEFPYLAKSYPSFPSILQASIDAHKDHSMLFLILCGSSSPFMKEQLLGRNSPLYGRRTAQIELRPFNYFEARAFFPDFDAELVADLYGMAGGVPLYLQQVNRRGSLENIVSATFLNEASILYEEPQNLIKQEVSKAGPYNAVLSAIANGASQHNEIALKAGIEPAALDYYLKELSRLDLIEREVPITSHKSRKARWRLLDNMFRFWFKYVRPNRALVERGMGKRATRRIVETYPEHMGLVFEDICREWLWNRFADERLGVEITDIGRWWGGDPVTKQEAEIDIVGVDGNKAVLIGECKWRNEPLGTDQLAKLNDRARLVGADSLTQRWLFSKSGFTEGCIELAATMPNTHLVSFGDMVEQQAI